MPVRAMSSRIAEYAATRAEPRGTRLASWRAFLRDAFGAGQQDLTHGSLRRAAWLLAIPMVLEMSMEAIFAITDIFFVASLGPAAVAAVGLTEAVMTLVYAVSVGLGMGVTALVARRIGEGDRAGAAVIAGQTLWLGLGTALAVMAVGLAWAPGILRAMGADAAVVAGGAVYTRVLLGGSLTVVLLFLLCAVFRGAGAPGVALRALALANGINIALDPCLIFGLGPFPALGVGGAAVATTIGRGIGVLYLLAHLGRAGGALEVGRAELAVRAGVMLALVRVSLGGILQFLIATASWVVLMRLVALHGSAAVAVYTIAIRIIDFTFLPAWGFANAAATLVGQHLGAGLAQRAREAVWLVTRYNVAFMLGVAAVFLLATESLIGWFSADPVVIAHGAECLRLVSYGYGLFAVGMVLTQAFNGAGDTYTPTWINFICFWLIQLPCAYTLSQWMDLGPSGVFAAITIAEVLVALLAWWQFQRGRWQTVSV
jgi:putative MATE family efflux protein